MSLKRSLVLNCYMNSLLGAESLEDLQKSLCNVEEGHAENGQSGFFQALAYRRGLRLEPGKLAEYDARLVAYEARLARNRRAEPFKSFKYFQYLALLYTEIFLDRLTSDQRGLLIELNLFRKEREDLADVPDFAPDDLRRLAFFMSTGSGKTLLLHVNIWQVLHYLKNGRHPEALVRRPDRQAEFDNIVLVTPGEGLSDQHLRELEDSGLDAARFIMDRESGRLFGPRVKVIEIHKLAEEPSADGVSIPLDEIGDRNLILVDEGHKGTGSEARAWKTRQHALSRNGFLLEYSATFKQAIGAASPAARGKLLAEYGKAILIDYSYRYFHADGYGKGFHVLNLKKAGAKKAHDLMLGGLLVFYVQARLYEQRGEELTPYNIERPLWVLLGTSVSKKKASEKDASMAAERERTDVAEVVAFLRRFLEDPAWAVERIGKTILGQSGFTEKPGDQDLFQPHLKALRKVKPKMLREEICRKLFHGRGALEVWELKNSGEVGLRVSGGGGKKSPYFAVINIGDVSSFKKHLESKLGLKVQEDRFSPSLFNVVSRHDSPIHMLIGAKKFIEGWSSWRVSAMGLLNVGKGEGSQVMQLFGRGIRLKGKDKSLKRSESLPGSHPDGLRHLETLYIFGWRADYIERIREMLDREDVAKELKPPLKVKRRDRLPGWLWVPATEDGYDVMSKTWSFDATGPKVILNLLPQVTAIAPAKDGTRVQTGIAGRPVTVGFDGSRYGDLIDTDALYAELLDYKSSRNYGNIFIRREDVRPVLKSRCEVRMLDEEASEPQSLHRAASYALKTYLDRFARQKRRDDESRHAEPAHVTCREMLTEYRITVRVGDEEGQELYREIQELLKKPIDALLGDARESLPRLFLNWHLFNPILIEGGKEWRDHVTIQPPPLVKGEHDLVRSLREFWEANHDKPPYDDLEVYLLRNLPKSGLSVFSGRGFYPDFILWLKHRKGGVHVRLLDPHGLHHGGLNSPTNKDRFDALKKLGELGMRRPFKAKKLTLDGLVLTDTPLEQIPGAAGRSWPELEREYPLIRQEGDYVEKLLECPV